LAPLYKLLGLTTLSSLIGSSLYEAITYYIILFYQLSYDSCSACLLPTIYFSNTPYIQTDPIPFWVVAGSKPKALPSSSLRFSTFYLGQLVYCKSRYTSRCLGSRPYIQIIGIRIRRRETLENLIVYDHLLKRLVCIQSAVQRYSSAPTAT